MLASKYRMTAVQAEAAQRQVEQRAAQDGLEFRMDGLRSGNTRHAHRTHHRYSSARLGGSRRRSR